MNKKVLIIHNPRAGQKKKIKLSEEIQKWSANREYVFDYSETKYAGHGTELTKKAIDDGYACVVAAGGDGTVNEIATTLVGTDVSLGIIPMGSGNGLARHHKIPMDLEKSFHLIFSGKSAKMDAGLINGKYFFCAAGIGFDSLVSEKFANSKTRGLISYFLIALKQYFKYNSKLYSIQINDKVIDKKCFFITFANANQFGNHAYIAPHAKIDDGKLDICLVSPFKWYKGFSLANRLFNGTIQKSKIYQTINSDKVAITSSNSINFHYDGEIMVNSSNKIDLSIKPKALNIIIP